MTATRSRSRRHLRVVRPRPRVSADFRRHLRAGSIQLVDPLGRPRGGFGFTDAGAPALMLLDADGTVRLIASLEGQTTQLALADATGQVRVSAAVPAHGAAVGLRVTDAAGRPRLMLGYDPGPDGPIIAAIEPDDTMLWGFPPRPVPPTIGDELEHLASADDAAAFRVAWRRAGLPRERVAEAWQRARAAVGASEDP